MVIRHCTRALYNNEMCKCNTFYKKNHISFYLLLYGNKSDQATQENAPGFYIISIKTNCYTYKAAFESCRTDK